MGAGWRKEGKHLDVALLQAKEESEWERNTSQRKTRRGSRRERKRGRERGREVHHGLGCTGSRATAFRAGCPVLDREAQKLGSKVQTEQSNSSVSRSV